MNLQIDINEIEKVVLNLLQELRDREGDVIELEPVDYYWTIDAEELYDSYTDPSNLTLG